MTERLEVVIATGDPQGIGPEVAAKAARALKEEDPSTVWRLVGDPDVLRGFPGGSELEIVPVPAGAALEIPGPSAAGGRAALAVLERACEEVDAASTGCALVTAPLSKAAVVRGGVPGFTGHTGWLGQRYGVPDPMMLFVAPSIRIALATVHVPLAAVPAALSVDGLVTALGRLKGGLQSRYGCSEPRIAVLGVNPHAGEAGLLGEEEGRVIEPAIREAVRSGVRAEGPFAADTFFRPGRSGAYDAVLAMYHDQGLLPLKTLAFGEAVNVTLGLPVIRTSVDHGCAFDIAGQGIAESGSMEAALRHARELLRRQLSGGGHR